MLVAALTPLLLLEVSRVWRLSEQVLHRRDEGLAAAAQAMARETRAVVDGHGRATETLASTIQVDSQSSEYLRRQLHSLKQRYGGFSYLVLAGPDGHARIAEPPLGADGRPSVGTDYSDRPYFQEVLRSRAFAVGGVLLGKRSGVPNVHFGVPVTDDAGSLVAVLCASLALEVLGDIATQIQGTTDVTVLLLDEEGKVVWHPDPAVRRAMTNIGTLPVYAVAAGGMARLGVDEGGQLVRTVVVPISLRNTQWRAVARTPLSHIESEVRVARERAGLLTFGAVALSVLLSWLLAGWLAAPIHQVAGALAAISAGRALARFPVRRFEMVEVAQLMEAAEDLRVRVTDERALRSEKDKAVQASQAKSTFLANMSHEIRTPINAIMGMTYLARKTVLTDQQRGYINRIDTSSRHLLGVVNDVLDYSRIESGKLSIERVRFSLAQVVRDVRHQVEQRAIEKGLTLTTFVAPGVPDTLVGDPLRLTQILVNFAGNAVKFTERGDVRIAIDTGEGPARPGTVGLSFSVSDTGIGISKAQQALLFRSFEQGDDSTTRRFGGSGLGLAICRQLAALKGGEVGVNSEPGVGSTFWLKAPFEIAGSLDAQAAAALVHAEPAALKGTRVLLVEDNDMNQEFALELLADVGCVTRLARNGQEALTLLRQADFDVVLMDLQMPVMDGLDATRAMRGIPGHEKTPVIAMTASVTLAEKDACLAAGMNGHLGKPIDADELFRTMLRWAPRPPRAPTIDPAAPDATVASLPAIDGLDLAAPLRRVGGNTALLLSLLRRFTDTRRLPLDLKAALDADDWATAHRLTHTFRSSAATLDFHQAEAAATRLEAAIDARADRLALDRLLAELRHVLEPVLVSLQAQLTTPSPVPAPPAAPPQPFEQVRSTLTALLERDDAEAPRVFAQHRAVLAAGLGAVMAELEQALWRYDFQAALRALARAHEEP